MLKLVCTLLDLKLNQLNKIGVYNMRQNQETYMIASLFSRRCGSYMM